MEGSHSFSHVSQIGGDGKLLINAFPMDENQENLPLSQYLQNISFRSETDLGEFDITFRIGQSSLGVLCV